MNCQRCGQPWTEHPLTTDGEPAQFPTDCPPPARYRAVDVSLLAPKFDRAVILMPTGESLTPGLLETVQRLIHQVEEEEF